MYRSVTPDVPAPCVSPFREEREVAGAVSEPQREPWGTAAGGLTLARAPEALTEELALNTALTFDRQTRGRAFQVEGTALVKARDQKG